MTTIHTPELDGYGNWQTIPGPYGDIDIASASGESRIATVHNPNVANLISAAPDLLAALRNLVNNWEPASEAQGRYTHDWNAARAAIAKAEGR